MTPTNKNIHHINDKDERVTAHRASRGSGQQSFTGGVALVQVLQERAARQVDKKLQKTVKEGQQARAVAQDNR